MIGEKITGLHQEKTTLKLLGLNMRKTLLWLFFSTSVFVGRAQNAPLWTLEKCISAALENNLKVKRGYYGVESADINLLQAKAAFLPTVNAAGSYGQNYGRAINPVTNSFIDRNSNTINLGGSGQLTLFSGFRTVNTYRQNQKSKVAADLDLEKTKNDVITNVVTLYATVLFNKELLDNANYLLTGSQSQLERTTKLVDAGSMSKGNQLTQEATVASNELTVINQENAYKLSVLQLKQAMQLPADSVVEIEVPNITIEDLTLTQSVKEIYETAKQLMPDVKSAEVKVEAARLSAMVYRGALFPRLVLSGNMQTNYSSVSNTPRTAPTGNFSLSDRPSGEDANGVKFYAYQPEYKTVAGSYTQQEQLKDNLYKSLNLQLNIPLFNGLQNRGNLQQAAVNQRLAENSKMETENALRQNIETAYNDAAAASKSYGAAQKQVTAREEAYRMDNQRYELGGLSALELQVSQSNLFQAKTDLTRAKYNFILRKKILDFYQGREVKF